MEKLFKILLVALFFSFNAIGQQYTPMTAAGYQMKRIKADSSLHLPSFCGVPTLKNSTAKEGALAIDTCGNLLYMWTRANGWDTVNVGGSTIDTTSLSNRINAKLSTSDSAIYYTKYRSDTSRSNIYAAIAATSDTASVVKALVHNAESTTITKGSVVYLYGANGNVASVKRAYNTSDTFSSKTFAIVKEDISSGQNGIVITQGVVDKLNLGSYTQGDIVWLDSIPGQFTKNKPSAPYHQVFIGVVERANNGNGQLYVKVQNGYELGELHNVSVNGQADNDVLYYQSSTKLWKAKSPYLLVDTSSLSNRIDTKLSTSDSSTYQTKYRSDTARTNVYNYISTKVNLSDSTLYQTKYRSDTSRTNIYNSLATKQSTLTFSTGLTNSSSTITNNLSTGVSGGQTIIGGTASGNSLTLSSTSNATKGKLIFGTSAYDEVNNRLGIGTTSPAFALDVQGSIPNTTGNILVIKNTNSALLGSPTLALDCSGTGPDQPVDIRLGSTNPKGIRMYTSNADLGSSPIGAGFQFYSNSSTNYPGQVYFDAGATNNGSIIFRTAQTSGTIAQRMRIFANGNISISSSTSDPGYLFNVNGSARVTSLFYSALSTTPASASASGTTGEVRIDANYIYVCTGTNTWKRAAIATW